MLSLQKTNLKFIIKFPQKFIISS
ncbi:hypothetical protein MTR67_016876 [Solanum verrucosum]|uniref:Uncharacterized protein n=1 Tax=Solanum verrucosum TaxID=315347 RepID=A0AAF0QHM8_SOLVR|nr:hypothetical protein MTR67_016876 [Solanum verrucosum]